MVVATPEAWYNEVKAIYELLKPNPYLLKILGISLGPTDDDRVILFELMQNGNLEDRLALKRVYWTKNFTLASHIDDHEKLVERVNREKSMGTGDPFLDPAMLTCRQRLRIVLDTLHALDYLHTRNLVHRDLKTANILLDHTLSAKLGDFGLVKDMGPGNQDEEDTGVAGTLVYMAPEARSGNVSSKMDVYAFGVVLLELLSGKYVCFAFSFFPFR